MLFEEGTVCKICGTPLAGRGLIGHEYCGIHYQQYVVNSMPRDKVTTELKDGFKAGELHVMMSPKKLDRKRINVEVDSHNYRPVSEQEVENTIKPKSMYALEDEEDDLW